MEICPLGCQGKRFVGRSHNKGTPRQDCGSKEVASMHCWSPVLKLLSAAAVSCWRSHGDSTYGGWRNCKSRRRWRPFAYVMPEGAVPGQSISHWELLAAPGTGHRQGCVSCWSLPISTLQSRSKNLFILQHPSSSLSFSNLKHQRAFIFHRKSGASWLGGSDSVQLWLQSSLQPRLHHLKS